MRKILFFIPLFLWTCGGGGSTAPEPPQLPTVTNIEVTTLEDNHNMVQFQLVEVREPILRMLIIMDKMLLLT